MFKYFYLLSISLVILSCSKDPIAELPPDINPEVERADNIEIFYSDSAKVKIKISGPVMLSHETNNIPQEEFTEGVLVDFFDEDGNPSSQLTAKYGTRFQRQNKVIVRDSVVWKSIENETIETEELIWDSRAKKVFTKKFARISRADEIIYGYGFEADQDFSNARIRAVTGRVKVDKVQ